MDWWKLFALLVAVASFLTTAEGAKKKIRIHLPQKVKHIHHHKKIYITNHPASSQYAPAFMPSSESAVAVSSNVGSISSLYDDRHLTAVSPAASKLLPLYRARGYYGPTPSEWEEQQEYDLVPPPEPSGPGFVPTAFAAPTAPAASASYPTKKIKLIKVKDGERRKKKVIRKRKPKRVVNVPPIEEEHPVTSFHEQFYSDLENAGTIRKIRKPKRVEKIVDGDTEHIHTYSEEHIHKVVFDDGPKLPGNGIDALGSMSALNAGHSLIPIKNQHSLFAADSDPYSTGSLGTPSHFEYASYNPRDVTHDHVFHDHGEIPPHVDLSKDSLGLPPKASYTSSGIKIRGNEFKRQANKQSFRVKPTRPTPHLDFSYYESIYSPITGKQKNPLRQSTNLQNEQTSEPNIDDFRPIPAFRIKDTPKLKKLPVYGKPVSAYGQASIPVPFSASGINGHDSNPSNSYTGVRITGTPSFSSFNDPLSSFRGVFSNNFAFDASSSPSNQFKGNYDNSWSAQGNKGKKKSISTQNVSFGGKDHKTIVDHLADSSNIQPVTKDGSAQITNFEGFDNSKPIETATPTTHYTITENSPAHDYYTAMALKAFQEDPLSIPEASNNNFQYAAVPQTTPAAPTITTATSSQQTFYRIQNSETTTQVPTASETRRRKVTKKLKLRNRHSTTATMTEEMRQNHAQPVEADSQLLETTHERVVPRQPQSSFKRGRAAGTGGRSSPALHFELHTNDAPSTRGNLKYGDKI